MHCLFIYLKTEALLSNENKTISEIDNAAAGNTGQKTAPNMYPVKNKTVMCIILIKYRSSINNEKDQHFLIRS
jgi:hypothetical protein